MAHSKPQVLDYSFMDIGNVDEITEKLDSALPPPEGREGPRRVNAAALRLPNNNLVDLTGLHSAASTVVKDPKNLKWLDLSFNSIELIPEDFSEFSDAAVVYLHGNEIESLKALSVLRSLKGLKKLTLHGNPIENIPHYRHLVMLLVPSLRMLDFSVVTSADKDAAEFLRKEFNAAMRSRKKQDDE
mmetsp:Transcript_92235/g.183707  ORF Transcript_92235/g.183707 Transcript_92235/m.183707 type:complete len:186 (+) Transcript_92235:70-627(+)|eukprot:CAMPEP_0171764876 /NCGR_PEP_ID=MMETSP0991-20121206/50267_1 /TAXON_ID=483369 /ORGANISM="non described non described, Strain CCMP2098" /LENGTH=185 /DNA_ID=CAMNT_0012369123 /DNA_START=23 /DNA_END=580 /DNA_ORIENTATION=-